jgi:hypothetical protein
MVSARCEDGAMTDALGAMTDAPPAHERNPLSALVSQLLVAFTIEFDKRV